MYERVQRQARAEKTWGLGYKTKEVWVVYDENFRDILFEAETQELCITWLRNQCSTGACEN
jgi:hypothetical protein